MWRVSMTEKVTLLVLTHTLQGQIHSHTHYIHVSLPAGGSLLRNNWHSEREYTAGICPWSPPLHTAPAWQGWGTCPQPVLSPISLLWWAYTQEFAQQAWLCKWLAGLKKLCPVWSVGKYAERAHSHQRTRPTRSDGDQLQECLMLTAKMLSSPIKMHDSMLGMLSHH